MGEPAGSRPIEGTGIVGYLVNGVVALLSVGAFILALYLAYQDQVAAAGVCIAAAILPILFSQLPFVEYLKILGLEAKLRERVNEAGAIVENLKRTALVYSEQMFSQIGYAGRWGGESLVAKRERVSRLTGMLEALEISPAQIVEAKRIFLRSIATDLALVFYSVLRNLVYAKQAQIRAERDAIYGNEPIRMEGPKYERWQQLLRDERSIAANLHWPDDIFDRSEVDDLKAFCLSMMNAVSDLTEQETAMLRTLADEVDTLWCASVAEGNVSTDTIRYLDKYQSSTSRTDSGNLRYVEAFPEASKKRNG